MCCAAAGTELESMVFLALSDVISWRQVYAVQPESTPRPCGGSVLQTTKNSSVLWQVLQCASRSSSNKAVVVKELRW